MKSRSKKYQSEANLIKYLSCRSEFKAKRREIQRALDISESAFKKILRKIRHLLESKPPYYILKTNKKIMAEAIVYTMGYGDLSTAYFEACLDEKEKLLLHKDS